MISLDQCNRELLSSDQTANIITLVNSKHPTWLALRSIPPISDIVELTS